MYFEYCFKYGIYNIKCIAIPVVIGGSCTKDSDCSKVANAECHTGTLKCVCLLGYIADDLGCRLRKFLKIYNMCVIFNLPVCIC